MTVKRTMIIIISSLVPTAELGLPSLTPMYPVMSCLYPCSPPDLGVSSSTHRDTGLNLFLLPVLGHHQKNKTSGKHTTMRHTNSRKSEINKVIKSMFRVSQ